MKINDTIKEIRKKTGMTQVAFAESIGCKQNTLSDYENGKALPSFEIINSIIKLAHSKKIKVKLEELFSEENKHE